VRKTRNRYRDILKKNDTETDTDFWKNRYRPSCNPHSACHLCNKTSTNSNFALAPISTLVRPALVNGFKLPLQINDFATFYMLPQRFLCRPTHFWQLSHCNELLPTPLLQTPHGYLTAFCLTFWRSPLIITLVLFILTLTFAGYLQIWSQSYFNVGPRHGIILRQLELPNATFITAVWEFTAGHKGLSYCS